MHKLEREQQKALKNIYWPGMSAKKMRKTAGILRERREEVCVKFAKKCVNSPRFGHWFPRRETPVRGRRGGVTYKEFKENSVRTKRYLNSPKTYRYEKTVKYDAGVAGCNTEQCLLLRQY